MVNVGIIQMQSIPLQLYANLSKAGRLISKVVEDGAHLVVLPEVFNVGFSFDEALMPFAEPLEQSKSLGWLKHQASRHRIYITTSIYEKFEGHFYNTMLMVGYDGSVQYYRKRNPTCTEAVVWRRSRTPGPGIFDTPFGRIGGVICFDSFARETFEGFKASCVDLVIIVACWGRPSPVRGRPETFFAGTVLKQWSRVASEIVPRQYAVKLKVPAVFVNQGGKIQSPSPMPIPIPFPLKNLEYCFCGKSHVRKATGEILVQAENAEDFYSVVPVDIQPSSPKPAAGLSNIPLNYLRSDYYFVQPPLAGKFFQNWLYKGLLKEYETRRLRRA